MYLNVEKWTGESGRETPEGETSEPIAESNLAPGAREPTIQFMKGLKRRRLLIASSTVIAAVAVYVWFFGVATMFVVQARWMGRREPLIYTVPAPLPDSSSSNSKVRKFALSRYEFEVPWSIDDSKTVMRSGKLGLFSGSGQILLVSIGQPKEFVRSFGGNPEENSNLRVLYGPDTLGSDYALHQYMLQTTPDQVRLTAPRRENVGRLMMLVTKSVVLPEAAHSGIFTLQTPEFVGFQYGDPRRMPKRIVVDLFADDGGGEFHFENQGGQLSQAEINRVIQSLHKVKN
jgi:hypothetical protein